ncbi:FAD-binding, type 2 [Lasallia pustulata]|uniref:FAD-binding, type 2 n=1 Tax=Lasallia pustulata TaxID=136370 RepID=A0A1W5D564_9LECA|nr:FAD-binding, type 2 [Lasallia pustulata]
MINLAASFDYTIIDTASGTALVGGGTNIGQFTNATFAAGRQVTVGTCWCVGVLGAGLGGGHGRLQGEAGLIIDNMIQLRVVLANGTIVNASEKENPDLFWGMRGAGQNFGVVVEANITTLPLVPGGTGYDVEMDFSPDQLEDVLLLANQQIAIQPPELSYYIFFGSDPVTLDLIFHINFVYVGPQADGRIWSAPWKQLGPIKFVEANFRWDELLYKSANGLIAAQCGQNGFKSTYSLNMAHFNVTTIQELVTSYTDFVHTNPSANQSILNLEVYSGHGVRAVPSNRTAYANRQFTNIMVAISPWYTDPSITNVVNKWCESARDSLQATAGYDSLHVYQNYAHNEPIQSYYGYEPWRLEKLMALKREYDPHGFFSGYAPIPLASR